MTKCIPINFVVVGIVSMVKHFQENSDITKPAKAKYSEGTETPRHFGQI